MIDALPLLLGPEGYQISRSVRLRSSASAYFNRTMAAGGVTVYTFSTWVKRGELGTIKPIVQGYLNNNNYGHIIFKADNTIEWREVSVAVNYGQVNTNAVFRDPSAWYHIVVVRNGTSLLIYVNGVSQTLTVSTAVNAANGYLFGGSTVQRIGSDQVNSAFFDGYLTECYLIDGQALTPSSFGETNPATGVWQPKKYVGTYGTNGFYLNFSDNSAATAAAIGKDYSGNGNNWTPNNISVTAGVTYDSMLDVPTQWADGGNGRGNYAVLNPLSKDASGTVLDGNLGFTASAIQSVTSTIAYPSSGKWYCEFQITTTPDNSVFELVGLTTANAASNVTRAYASNGQYYNGSAFVTFGSAWAINDVIGIAADIDNSQVSFYKNGTLQGSTQTFAFPADYAPMMRARNTGTSTFNANFGQRPFAYTPPSGFKALNTLNLPTPTILKGNQYFDVKTHIGYSTGAWFGLGTEFDIDLIWTKNRSGAYNHVLVDSVRGDNNSLASNTTAAENNAAGVLLGRGANSKQVYFNGSVNEISNTGQTYVDWCWKEGATQGFDIVLYTGDGTNNRTVSHSLGVTPSMVIVKSRTSSIRSWFVAHRSLATNNNLLLQSADMAYGPSAFGSGVVGNLTSSVFECVPGTIAPNNTANINANGENFIAYLFAAVAGYSAFGSYTGNGSADGTFVFTGFRPRYVMIKGSSFASNWFVIDTSRSSYNVSLDALRPNLDGAEVNSPTTTYSIDILSNGFKLRTSAGDSNTNGATFIYACFAENPFKNALAR